MDVIPYEQPMRATVTRAFIQKNGLNRRTARLAQALQHGRRAERVMNEEKKHKGNKQQPVFVLTEVSEGGTAPAFIVGTRNRESGCGRMQRGGRRTGSGVFVMCGKEKRRRRRSWWYM